jgi:hypothetical protein
MGVERSRSASKRCANAGGMAQGSTPPGCNGTECETCSRDFKVKAWCRLRTLAGHFIRGASRADGPRVSASADGRRSGRRRFRC